MNVGFKTYSKPIIKRRLISDVLRELREYNELSKHAVAVAAGVSDSTYAAWESGTTCPSLYCAADLARFYGVSVDYIAGLGGSIYD